MIRLYRAVCRLIEAHAGHPEPFELRGGIARTQDDLLDDDDRAHVRRLFRRRSTVYGRTASSRHRPRSARPAGSSSTYKRRDVHRPRS